MLSVDLFISNLVPWQSEVVTYLRNTITQSSPGIIESLKYGCPYYEYKKHLCYINPRKEDIVLGFVQGKKLAETNPILVGEQKQVRHIVIKKITPELDQQIRYILQEAILLNDELYKKSKLKWK